MRRKKDNLGKKEIFLVVKKGAEKVGSAVKGLATVQESKVKTLVTSTCAFGRYFLPKLMLSKMMSSKVWRAKRRTSLPISSNASHISPNSSCISFIWKSHLCNSYAFISQVSLDHVPHMLDQTPQVPHIISTAASLIFCVSTISSSKRKNNNRLMMKMGRPLLPLAMGKKEFCVDLAVKAESALKEIGAVKEVKVKSLVASNLAFGGYFFPKLLLLAMLTLSAEFLQEILITDLKRGVFKTEEPVVEGQKKN